MTKKIAKSYFGGDITERQKKNHEKRLAELLLQAEKTAFPSYIASAYRAFVAFAGKQRHPVTGSAKMDQRFLAGLGLAGEGGEVNNVIKKLMFRHKVGSRTLTKEQRAMLIDELGDAFWYFMLVLIAFDVSLNEVMMGNMKKLVARGR